jgi:O-methyltransferase involved in polyketide biosynthesis
MSRLTLVSQDKIAETLLIALNARAVEAHLPHPLLRDKHAIALVEQIDYDFSRFKLAGHDQATTIMRLRQFDRYTQDFLSRHPLSVVVHFGCGLDTRFERVDNGLVEWYDLDLPEVMSFRQRLIPSTERSHQLGYSVFDHAWLEAVMNHPERAYLFLAEGVLPYFTEEQVRQLFTLLADKFPGCELVCDGMTSAMIRLHNLKLSFSKVGARLNWALKNGCQPETWGACIHLISEWFYFDRPEPRLGSSQLMRYIPLFAKGVGIFHYQLGINHE